VNEAFTMTAISIAELWRVIVLGIVEGITEFLPISSTGHLIIASDLLNFSGSLGGTFEIFIQLGAVLAVVWYYRRDLWQQVRSVPHDRAVQRFWLNGVIAFLPAALIGLLVHDWIKERLFNPVTVAVALVVGGVILLLVERRVSGAHNNAVRHDATTGARGGAGANVGADPRHVALGQFDHWRLAGRVGSQNGDGVFFLSGDSNAGTGDSGRFGR